MQSNATAEKNLINADDMFGDASPYQAESLQYIKVNKEMPRLVGILEDISPRPAHTRKVLKKGKWETEEFESQTCFHLNTAGIKGQQDLGVVVYGVNDSKLSILSHLVDAEEGDLISFEFKGTKGVTTKDRNATNIVVPALKKLG
jgi:hypothetical protein